MDPTASSETPDARRATASISNLLVGLVREFTGRGPTKARTYMQDDVVTVVLQGTLTKGEQHLVDDGRAEHVLQTRKYYQDAMRTAAIAGIEDLTGRRVIAFMSDNHIDPDMAAETFVLEPRSSGAGHETAAETGAG